MVDFSSPYCAVEIYTFEGGSYTFFSSDTTNGILSCIVDFHIMEGGSTCSLLIAPGGPNGIAAAPSWTELITPMSFIVIAMQRGGFSNVVFLGFVTNIQESQVWNNKSVNRTISIAGVDFSIFFKQFNWASLSFLGANALAKAASSLYGNPNESGVYAAGLLYGTPAQMATNWLTKVMVGKDGLLSNTIVPYKGNQRIPLRNVLSYSFSDYPADFVPYGDNFMSEDSNWDAKFREMLQFPPFEFFISSGPPNIWVNNLNLTQSFSSLLLPNAVPASPQVIGRINPQPDLAFSVPSAIGVFNFTNSVSTNFTNLQKFQLQNFGFMSSNIAFGINDARNFYAVNPTGINYAYTGNADNTNLFFMAFNGAADPSSIGRYGYRPYQFSTKWFNSFSGPISTQENAQTFVAMLICRLVSYIEPLPLMANGELTMELRPDIFAGNLFQYSPFRPQTDEWTFYIEGVTHTYTFGGPSTTALTLSRGLPTAVYADANLLFNILQGNAMRTNGNYVIGLPKGSPPATIQVGLTAASQLTFLSDIAKGYVTAQFK